MSANQLRQSPERCEWPTPQAFFDLLDAEFHFDLDAAATKENAKCQRFFTVEDDGLSQDWTGTVWCNPPYGREIGLWVEKGYRESQKGATVVLLVPASTDVRWFHEYALLGEVRFVKGRLKFGQSKTDAPFGSVLVIYRR